MISLGAFWVLRRASRVAIYPRLYFIEAASAFTGRRGFLCLCFTFDALDLGERIPHATRV